MRKEWDEHELDDKKKKNKPEAYPWFSLLIGSQKSYSYWIYTTYICYKFSVSSYSRTVMAPPETEQLNAFLLIP